MKPLRKPRNWSAEDSVGWMFMGEHGGPCDKSCQMCYYAHQKNLVFYSYETLVQHANLFKHYYKLDACDITGGEPTIFKTKTGDIVDLVGHCANIGLKPRIITHGQNLRDNWMLGRKRPLYKEIEDAGLELWRISIHGGSAASHDEVLGSAGSFDAMVANFDNLSVETQFNTTLLNTNYKDLPVNVLRDRDPTVWNIIYFLPYFYWSDKTGKTEAAFQVTYRDAAPFVARAIEEMESLGWEVNLRYFPLCISEEFGFAENVSGYHQVPFDPWEWRLNVTQRVPIEQIESEGGWYNSERKRALTWMASRDNEVCSRCSYKEICDKPPEQYQEKYGLSELRPVEGTDELHDPLHFQKQRGRTTAKEAVG